MSKEDLPHNDKELLGQLSTGSESAFDSIYRKYWPSLYDSAFRRLENWHQAEDLVQEVFLRLWNKRAELHIDNLAAYLHTAVRFEVLTYISRHRAPVSFYEPFEAMFLEQNLPDARIRIKELIDLIAAYAHSLPEKRRQIFLLHIDEKLSTKEMAEILNISQKTVQNQLATALKGLRGYIDPTLLLVLFTHYIKH